MRGVRCPNCKAELNEQSVLCAFCGTAVDATALATEAVPESRWDEFRELLPEGLPRDATVVLEDTLHDSLGRMRVHVWERHGWLLAPVTAVRMSAAGLLIAISTISAAGVIWLVYGLLVGSASALSATAGVVAALVVVVVVVCVLVWAVRHERLTATVWVGIGLAALVAAVVAVLLLWRRLHMGLGESVVAVFAAVGGAVTTVVELAAFVWVKSNGYLVGGLFALSFLLWTWAGIRIGGTWVQTRVWRLGLPPQRRLAFVLGSAVLGSSVYFLIVAALGAGLVWLGFDLSPVVALSREHAPPIGLVEEFAATRAELGLRQVVVAALSGAIAAFVGFLLLYTRGLRTTVLDLFGLRIRRPLYFSDASMSGGRTFLLLAGLGAWTYLLVRHAAAYVEAARIGMVDPDPAVAATVLATIVVLAAPFLLWLGWDLTALVVLAAMTGFTGSYGGEAVRPDWYDIVLWFVVAVSFVVAGAQAARRLERPTPGAGFAVGAGVGVLPAIVGGIFALVNVGAAGPVFSALAAAAPLLWAAVFGGGAGAATAYSAAKAADRMAARRRTELAGAGRGPAPAPVPPALPPHPPAPPRL